MKPTVLDFALRDEDLRTKARAAMAGSLSPMFAIRNAGIDVERVLCDIRKNSDTAEDARCVTYDVTDSEFREDMKRLANRCLSLLLDDCDVQLGGKLSVRRYPASQNCQPLRLGAHTDGNLFTLLFADSSGLEVVTDSSNLTPSDIMLAGVPSTSATPSAGVATLRDDDWKPIEGIFDEPHFLLTCSNAWFRSTKVKENWNSAFPPPQSPCFHRVRIKAGSGERLSIPFLVDFAAMA